MEDLNLDGRVHFVDNIRNIRQLSWAALNNNTKIDVAVELHMDIGSFVIELWKARTPR